MQHQRVWMGRCVRVVALFGGVGLASCGDMPGEPSSSIGSARQALGGAALPGLTAAQNAAFLAGQEAFEEVETLDDGLGPVFNEKACANCHDQGATGGPG